MRRPLIFFVTFALLFSTLAACGAQTASEPVPSATEPAVTEASQVATETSSSKALIAYFSRAGENYGVGVVEKGNTEIVADMILEETGADVFRIQTVNAYPESYDQCTEVAKQEQQSQARPQLTSSIENFDDYDVIYLGYPIWWGDMPMAVYTFLESYDFTGKIIRPFCTHAGSGLADTVGHIQSICGGSEVSDGLAVAGVTAQNDSGAARELVEGWLQK